MKTTKMILMSVSVIMIITTNMFGDEYANIYPEKIIQQQPRMIQQQKQQRCRLPANQCLNQRVNQQRYNNRNRYARYAKETHKTLNKTIVDLADRLFSSSRIRNTNMSDIAITSFVDLDKFNKTTHFGRTISESFFDELFVRGFNVTDFRGQNSLSVNANGEYFITRDVEKLNKNIMNQYILVGTYSKFEDSISINARIMDNSNGRIVASARSYYHSTDCKILENCVEKKPRKLAIVTDGCSTVIGCPKSCPNGICGAKYEIKRNITKLVDDNKDVNSDIQKKISHTYNKPSVNKNSMTTISLIK